MTRLFLVGKGALNHMPRYNVRWKQHTAKLTAYRESLRDEDLEIPLFIPPINGMANSQLRLESGTLVFYD